MRNQNYASGIERGREISPKLNNEQRRKLNGNCLTLYDEELCAKIFGARVNVSCAGMNIEAAL